MTATIKLGSTAPLKREETPDVVVELAHTGNSRFALKLPDGRLITFEALVYAKDGPPECIDIRGLVDATCTQWSNGGEEVPTFRALTFDKGCRSSHETQTVCLLVGPQVAKKGGA